MPAELIKVFPSLASTTRDSEGAGYYIAIIVKHMVVIELYDRIQHEL